MRLKRDEYRAYDAINASYLKRVLSHSVWHANVPFAATAQMEFGTAAHAMLLEPEVFADQYEMFDGDRRTKAGKEAYQAIVDEGKTPISVGDMERLSAMAKNVLAHGEVQTLLSDVWATEVSYTFESPYFENLLCKGQIDLFTNDNVLVDVKTISDIGKAEKQFFNLHYDLQLAFYRDALVANGHKVDAVKVLFIETAAPHQIALYDLSDDVLFNGVDKIKTATRKYLDQRELVHPELIKGTIQLPPWAAVEQSEESPF